jgi:hypothetical protein
VAGMKRGMGDDGQVYTMEGVIAGLILVLTLMYLTSSITLVSPQTEKALVMKQGIKAADVLNVLAAENSTVTNYNQLSSLVAQWDGHIASFDNPADNPVSAIEPYIMRLNRTIDSMLHDSDRHNNTLFNVYLIYNNGPSGYTTMPIILNGEPSDFDNAASAAKIIVLNENDLKSDNWKFSDPGHTILRPMPLVIEVRLVIWSI